ncbi:MAG: hypothetical protein GVY04_17005 [Cyanobacteria bacterium]|jgi:hypothetical protein|nr:hypothetical protein [Cyanobacteria bacterium GSL.Bin1]
MTLFFVFPAQAQLTITDTGNVIIGQGNDPSKLTVNGPISTPNSISTLGQLEGATLNISNKASINIEGAIKASSLTTTGAIKGSSLTISGPLTGYGTVPIGGIIDWWRPNGSTMEVPENFVICDGTTIQDRQSPFYGEKTPDLTDKFTRGVQEYARIGQAGGQVETSGTVEVSLPNTTGSISTVVPSAANTNFGLIVRTNPETNNYRFSLSRSDVDWHDGQHVHNLGGKASGETGQIETIPTLAY